MPPVTITATHSRNSVTSPAPRWVVIIPTAARTPRPLSSAKSDAMAISPP